MRSPEQDLKLREMVDKHYGRERMAAAFGIRRDILNKWMRELGIGLPREKVGLSDVYYGLQGKWRMVK